MAGREIETTIKIICPVERYIQPGSLGLCVCRLALVGFGGIGIFVDHRCGS